jgi:hypothetical protein
MRAYSDATIELIDGDSMAPGDSGSAILRPHLPEDWSELAVGDSVEFYEGPYLIGIARITATL